MKLFRSLRRSALMLVPVALMACDDDDTMMAPQVENIIVTAEANGSFSTLLTAVEAAGLTATLEGPGPFTVFAPTDDAFAALPAGTVEALLADPDALADILLYHVIGEDLGSGEVLSRTFIETLNGQSVAIGGAGTVDGATIVITDVEATNGTIHVIDAVILPSTEDIVEIAVGNSAFSTLVTALGVADLVEALQDEGPFTVFAPTDDAFAAVPSEVLNALLADPSALAQVLTYHVVPGRVLSPEVAGLTSAETLNGASVSFRIEGGAVKVDEATVIATDVQGTNGVIHIIDAVILPPGLVIN